MKARILVAEDDGSCREALREYLRFSGFDVVDAGNGAELVEHLRSAVAPVVLVMDLWMPVMSGMAVLDLLHLAGALTAFPTIVVTAADTELPEKYGSVTFLRKPVEPERLLALVATLTKDAEKNHRSQVAARAALWGEMRVRTS